MQKAYTLVCKYKQQSKLFGVEALTRRRPVLGYVGTPGISPGGHKMLQSAHAITIIYILTLTLPLLGHKSHLLNRFKISSKTLI